MPQGAGDVVLSGPNFQLLDAHAQKCFGRSNGEILANFSDLRPQ